MLKLQDRQGDSAVLRLKLSGANEDPQVAGLDQLPGTSNYFIGNDSTKWRTDVPLFSQVYYAAIYPGIDLRYHGNQGQLEYDFIVAPGADSRVIKLNFDGADRIAISDKGDLLLGVAAKASQISEAVCLPGDQWGAKGSGGTLCSRWQAWGRL